MLRAGEEPVRPVPGLRAGDLLPHRPDPRAARAAGRGGEGVAERLPPDGAGEADPPSERRRGGLAGGKDQGSGVS